MELRSRAEFYSKVVGVLYSKRGLRGRLVNCQRGARHISLAVRLTDPLGLDTAIKLSENIALATNTRSVIAQRLPALPGLISYQFELRQAFWQSYTRQDLTLKTDAIGVGLGEAHRQIDFTFDGAPHGLVAGTTGSGKTETLKTILTGLFTTYSPDELNCIIIDPHNDLSDFTNVAHLQGLPVATSPDDIDHVLSYAGQQLAHRKANNYKDAPRLVVAIDEAENCLHDGRLAIVQTIGAEGRKYRTNLLVSTQRPQEKTLPGLLHLLLNRWVGLVDDARTSAMLSGKAGLECHLLSGTGDFVHTSGATQERLQVAVSTLDDIDKLPRGDITPPVVQVADIPRSDPNGRAPGRPEKDIDPVAIGHYLWHRDLSISQAKEILGLSRRQHDKHKEFAAVVRSTIMELRGVTA